MRWLFDLFPLLSNGPAVNRFAGLFWDRFADYFPSQIAGVESVGMPLVTSIAVEGSRRGYDVNTLVLRKKRAKHGRLQRVEVNPLPDLRVVLVDDLVNSARSRELARQAMAEIGLASPWAFGVVNFTRTGPPTGCAAPRARFTPWVRPGDFGLTVASATPPKNRRSGWHGRSPRPTSITAPQWPSRLPVR